MVQGWHCAVHNVHWQIDLPSGGVAECPLCLRKQINELKAKLGEVTEHRDALLAVVEIKRTVIEGPKVSNLPG